MQLEKDFDLNHENLNELIIWFCCHLLEDSNKFVDLFSTRIKIFPKILIELRNKIKSFSSYTLQSLRIIHIYIKIKKDNLDSISDDVIESIVKIILDCPRYLEIDECRIHLLYIIYFLLDNQNHKIKIQFTQNYQILINLLNFNYSFEKNEIQLIIRIIGNLLRGDNYIVDVNFIK